jgi:hypothetical protein
MLVSDTTGSVWKYFLSSTEYHAPGIMDNDEQLLDGWMMEKNHQSGGSG